MAAREQESSARPEQYDDKKRINPTWAVARAVAKFRSEPRINQAQRKRRGSQWSYAKRDSFIDQFTTLSHGIRGEEAMATAAEEMDLEGQEALVQHSCHFLVKPDGAFLFYWLMLVTLAVLYNVWVPMARLAIFGIFSESGREWLWADLFFDAIYLADISIQARTVYMEHGLFVEDGRLLACHYFKSRHFLYDILAILPVDIILLVATGGMCPLVRGLRLFKIYRARQFTSKVEAAAACPNFWRISGFVHTLLFLVHVVSAIYLTFCRCFPSNVPSLEMMKEMEGYQVNTTANLTQYVSAVYWATVTLSTIGDVPWPDSEVQYFLQIIGYLVGIFVFATIVGQVGSVVDQRNAPRMEFERQLDHAKKYMREHEVPKEVQKSILGWYEYNWSRGKSVRKDDTDSFEMLPTKLRTELAIHVNLKTLKKVTFFTKCEPEFLHELVLRMQLVVTTPEELVCRKGEVAREMFIISDGLLEVLGEDDSVIRTLHTGDYFGEIGLLMTDGGSKRRTADVRSLGYSDIFEVTKEDILNLLEDYPNAKRVLQERVRLYSTHDRMRREATPNGHSTGLPHEVNRRSSNRFKDRMRRSLLIRNSSNVKDLNKPQRASLATSFRQKRYQNVMERKMTETGDVNGSDRKINEDIARDVMTSIEDTLFSKLSKVSREYNRLYTRSEILEEELDRKTKELEELKSKNLSVSSGSDPLLFKVGDSDADVEDKIW